MEYLAHKKQGNLARKKQLQGYLAHKKQSTGCEPAEEGEEGRDGLARARQHLQHRNPLAPDLCAMWRKIMSQQMFLKSSYRSELPQKSVNLSIIDHEG